MKHLKTLLALAVIAALLTCPALAISLQPGSGSDFYVADNANVLSAGTKSTILDYNAVLEQQCHNAQLVVVTVNYLDDDDTQIAATQLMNDWGVGSASDANGMLLLLVAKEYRGWLVVGDGIDEMFTDDMAGLYLDKYFWDYIDNDQFDKGVTTLCKELYQWYLDFYSVQTPDYAGSRYLMDTPYDGMYGPPVATQRSADSMAILILVLIVVIIWVSSSRRRYRRMRGWGYTGGFWPVFWFGGRRHYRNWSHQHMRPPSPGPGPGPHFTNSSFSSRPRSSGGGAGRSGGFHSGGFSGGSSFHGGGFGGHSGGGGGGRH